MLRSACRDAGDAGSNPALGKPRSGHVTTRSMSLTMPRNAYRDAPPTRMLTFAAKKLSTGASGQKEGAAPPFCPSCAGMGRQSGPGGAAGGCCRGLRGEAEALSCRFH